MNEPWMAQMTFANNFDQLENCRGTFPLSLLVRPFTTYRPGQPEPFHLVCMLFPHPSLQNVKLPTQQPEAAPSPFSSPISSWHTGQTYWSITKTPIDCEHFSITASGIVGLSNGSQVVRKGSPATGLEHIRRKLVKIQQFTRHNLSVRPGYIGHRCRHHKI